MLIVGHSFDSLGRIWKSRVIDPPSLTAGPGWVAQTFFELDTSYQTLDKLVSRKAWATWVTYFGNKYHEYKPNNVIYS